MTITMNSIRDYKDRWIKLNLKDPGFLPIAILMICVEVFGTLAGCAFFVWLPYVITGDVVVAVIVAFGLGIWLGPQARCLVKCFTEV